MFRQLIESNRLQMDSSSAWEDEKDGEKHVFLQNPGRVSQRSPSILGLRSPNAPFDAVSGGQKLKQLNKSFCCLIYEMHEGGGWMGGSFLKTSRAEWAVCCLCLRCLTGVKGLPSSEKSSTLARALAEWHRDAA